MRQINTYPVYSKKWTITDKTAVEAGYVDDPRDSGGKTNHGITEKLAIAYKKYWVTFHWDGDMETMPVDFAYFVYEMEFWKKLNLESINSISPVLSDKMFDIAINCGWPRCGRWLQEILNVLNRNERDYEDLLDDGLIGGVTIGALQAFLAVRGKDGEKAIVAAMLSKQGNHYIELAAKREKDEAFVFGWLTHRVVQDMTEYSMYWEAQIA